MKLDIVPALRRLAEAEKLYGCKTPDSGLVSAAAAEIERLLKVVEFYADPENYHAVAFMADHPCGDFADDFCEDELTKASGYNRPMPGKRAREALGWSHDEHSADEAKNG
jgi:hypothetical protein